MTDLERKIKSKIPGKDTGIEIRHTFCDICTPGSHCGVDAYVRDGKILKMEGTPGHPQNDGKLCTKGACGRAYLYSPKRLLTPMRRIGKRGEGKFIPISWEEAYGEIAEQLGRIRENFGADSVMFYSGYPKSYRFLLQRFAHVFGSINYGSESSACFTASRMGWLLMTGMHAGNDMKHAKLYLAWANDGHYSRYLAAEKLDEFHRRGGKVIVVDPRLTPRAQRSADLYLRIKPGTDGLLALGIAGMILRAGKEDKDYIRKYVHGFEEFRQYVFSIEPKKVSEETGVPLKMIRKAAEMIAAIRPMSVEVNPNSLIHQTNGLQTVRAVFALSAITGNYDTIGGNRPTHFTFCERSAGFSTREEQFATEKIPEGYENRVGAARYPVWARLITQCQSSDLPRQILEGTPYPIRGIYAHGMNHRIFPDPHRTEAALQKLDFFADVDLFLTDTAKFADIVLPACTSYEREEFKVYPGGWGEYYKPAVAPLGSSKPDCTILKELAEQMHLSDPYLTMDYRTLIAHILEGSGMDFDRLIETDGPVRADKVEKFEPYAYLEHGCRTPSGKLELFSETIRECGGELNPLPVYEPPAARPNREYPFILQTGTRIPNAIHTHLHDIPWERVLRPYPAADISPEDAERLGIQRGDRIVLKSPFGEITVRANPTALVAPGQVYMFHGYREADVAALLDPDAHDAYSGFPAFKSAVCDIQKAEGDGA